MLRETLLGYLIDFLSQFECLASGVHLEIFHRENLKFQNQDTRLQRDNVFILKSTDKRREAVPTWSRSGEVYSDFDSIGFGRRSMSLRV